MFAHSALSVGLRGDCLVCFLYLAVELVRDGCHGGGAVEELRDLLPSLFTWRHYPLTGIKGHSTRPPCSTSNLPENKVPLQLDNNDTYFLPFSFSAANPANHLAEDSGSADEDDDLEEDIGTNSSRETKVLLLLLTPEVLFRRPGNMDGIRLPLSQSSFNIQCITFLEGS